MGRPERRPAPAIGRDRGDCHDRASPGSSGPEAGRRLLDRTESAAPGPTADVGQAVGLARHPRRVMPQTNPGRGGVLDDPTRRPLVPGPGRSSCR